MGAPSWIVLSTYVLYVTRVFNAYMHTYILIFTYCTHMLTPATTIWTHVIPWTVPFAAAFYQASSSRSRALTWVKLAPCELHSAKEICAMGTKKAGCGVGWHCGDSDHQASFQAWFHMVFVHWDPYGSRAQFSATAKPAVRCGPACHFRTARWSKRLNLNFRSITSPFGKRMDQSLLLRAFSNCNPRRPKRAYHHHRCPGFFGRNFTKIQFIPIPGLFRGI